MNESRNLIVAREYLAALASGATGAELARAEQGKRMLRQQHYTIRNAIAQGDEVAMEADWQAELAIPVGSLSAGATMKAKFAMFFSFVDGRVRLQRNYDCFEPW